MRLVGLSLNLIFAALLAALSPWIAWRMLRQGRYRQGWAEKLGGRLPRNPNNGRPLVWFHAVSVGEVMLLPELVRRLTAARPDAQVLVTSSTDTGHAVAKKLLPACSVSWMPLDFTWSVRWGLDRVRPDLLVLTELELWPNLLAEVGRRRIPLMLLNGRLSERSARGYGRIRPLISRLLPAFRCLAVQTEDHAERFRDLGAPSRAVHVTGSLKFDGVSADRSDPRVTALHRAFGIQPGEPVFVAGSTIAGEEAAALDAWEGARAEFPRLRLILVPRHRERFEEVAQLVSARGLAVVRRTTVMQDSPAPAASDAVLLLDTLGELSACWGLADIAFVGGSLTGRRGGQNMIEPAAYGAAVLFGPHTRNFQAVVASLLAEEAALVVSSTAELGEWLIQLLRDRTAAKAMGERAREIVLHQQGATEKTLALLLGQLPAQADCQTRRAA